MQNLTRAPLRGEPAAPDRRARFDLAGLPQQQRWPRRATYALVATLIGILIVSLAGFDIWQEKQRDRERALIATQNIARLLDQNISDTFDRIDIGLRSVSLHYRELAARGSLNPKAVNQYLDDQKFLQPDLISLRIVGPEGFVRYGVSAQGERPTDLSDRDFFIRARDNPDAAVVLSGPLRARIAGQMVMVLARRITLPDNTFGGVVYANIAVTQFQHILSSIALGRHGAATIRTIDFGLVQRYPETQGAAGNKEVSKQLRDAIRSHPDGGTYRASTALDGIERSNAYRRLQRYPLYVIVGLATDDYLSGWRNNVLMVSSLALLAVLATSLAAAMVYRTTRRLAVDIEKREKTEAELRASEQELQKVQSLSSMGNWSWDIRNGVHHWSDEIYRIYGRDRGQAPAAYPEVGSYFTPDSWAILSSKVDACLAAGVSYACDVEVVRPDGGHRWASIFGEAQRDAAGAIAKLCGTVQDITERKQAETNLRIAATAFESQLGMAVAGTDQVILRVNRAFTEITGYTAQEAIGQTPRLISSGRHDAAFYEAMWAQIALDGAWHGEIWNRRKDGQIYPEWLTITAVKDEAGNATHYVGAFTDISAHKTAEERIKTLALYDPLTRLPNRRLLMDRLSQALISGARHQRKGALLFVDLDNFKSINDTQGHYQGDLLLEQVARRLLACVRDGDTVARLGGDEFVVMLEDLGQHEADATALAKTIGEKILAALDHIYHLGDREHHSTSSIGVTLFGGLPESIDEPLKRADLAMYQAKAAGRNTLCFFDPQMQAIVKARVAMEEGLRDALEKNQFLLYYQAQVTDQSRLAGAEVLLRWMHPARGLVSPAEFIPLAEETGLILPLGQWVLDTACAQLARWAGRPEMAQLTIAVNVSPRQFHQADFVSQVLALLARSGANPRRLKLELTESLLISNVEDVIAKMSALKAVGVGFSLDDFGTGYSSLSYLKRLPLDQLKIDQGFVRDILIDSNDAAIARMVIVLAESLGLAVIAEGVETEAQRDFLATQGCHAYQGYLFSRPLPLEEFEALAARTSVEAVAGAV